MPNEKAQKIIRDAMESREVYERMARKEAEVWSNYFEDPEKEEIRQREQQAGLKLKPTRCQLRLPQALASVGIKPATGLSLGCGSGRAERGFLKQGICNSFHGVDIAPQAIEQAILAAQREGQNCTYEVQDLNDLSLTENSYDLVVAQTSLHHVLRLEHVMDQVAKSLTPGGVFWVHDYIGESQFQFSDERLEIMNDLLSLLPESLTLNHFTKKPVKRVNRREPGELVSPFESIRSGEIKPLLMERFEVLAMHEESSFMHRIAGLGMKQNFVADANAIALFEIMLYFDQLLVKKNILPPTLGQYLLRPKRKV
jgi:2-polyprenyl-3-methyl-5-hydroxy-6-metoxy-1,4-benzoquinol methylase